MPRIAIVGAGMAGLTAALTLQDAGLSCDIYEASERVGGRMHSDRTTWRDGMVSEWCGEFIDSDHETIHRLTTRFGLATTEARQGEGGRTPGIMYLLHRYYRADELATDFQALVPHLQQQMQEAGFPTTYDRFSQEGFRLDQMSAYEWIERHVEGGHQTPVGHLLEAACTGFYGLDTGEQSALNLLYLFGEHGPLRDSSTPASMRGSRKILGGNEQLPLAIARSLEQERIHLHHQLVAIERTGEAALSLTFATADGPAQVQCERAILALPFSTLRLVDYQRAGFDSLKRAAIEELGYGTISKLFLQFDRPYWDGEGPWPHPHNGFFVTDLQMQALWDASAGQAGSCGLLVVYLGGRQGGAFAPEAAYTTAASTTIQSYARRALQHLEQLFPGIGAHYIGRAALSYPTGDPYLRGSYACWRVGQYTRFAGYEGVRQGPVHFAGEHCSVEFQGFMEGAAREGIRAAQEVIQDWGQKSNV